MTPKKNANGEGSGYRRADGTYVRVLSYHDEATGKTRRLYLYGRPPRLRRSSSRKRRPGSNGAHRSRTLVGPWAIGLRSG